MSTLRVLVKRDEASASVTEGRAAEPQDEGPKISMRDFTKALSKVLPSVSKRDELLYKSLEGSLRKSRSSLTTSSGLNDKDGIKKPTPMKY